MSFDDDADDIWIIFVYAELEIDINPKICHPPPPHQAHTIHHVQPANSWGENACQDAYSLHTSHQKSLKNLPTSIKYLEQAMWLSFSMNSSHSNVKTPSTPSPMKLKHVSEIPSMAALVPSLSFKDKFKGFKKNLMPPTLISSGMLVPIYRHLHRLLLLLRCQLDSALRFISRLPVRMVFLGSLLLVAILFLGLILLQRTSIIEGEEVLVMICEFRDKW